MTAVRAGTTTDFLWDREAALPLLVDDGTSASLHGDGLLAEIDADGTTRWPLADALGSVRGLTDATGSVTGTSDYAVFGQTRAQTGTASVFGFAGELTDAASGLLHLRARDLDPAIGRFLSADTVQPNAPGTQGYHRYAYVANNPTSWIDPSGHTVDDALALGGDVGALIDRFFEWSVLVEKLASAPIALGPLRRWVGDGAEADASAHAHRQTPALVHHRAPVARITRPPPASAPTPGRPRGSGVR